MKRGDTIEWVENGVHNIFVNDPIEFITEDPRHDYDPQPWYWMDGDKQMSVIRCYCGCDADHWMHKP